MIDIVEVSIHIAYEQNAPDDQLGIAVGAEVLVDDIYYQRGIAPLVEVAASLRRIARALEERAS